MPDPLTITAAITLAGKAFSGIQKVINSGRELEDAMGHVSRWFECVHDVNKAQERAKKPSLFKKITNASSVEKEALDALIAKRKLYEQRKQLREIVLYSWGKEAWDELIAMEKQIRIERTKAIHARVEFMRKITDFVAIAGFIIFLISLIIGGLWIFNRGV